MKLKSLDIQILKFLFKSEQGLFIYTIFQRVNASPKDLFEAIEKLKSMEFISEESDRISLTAKGKEFIIHNKLIAEDSSNKFGKIPERFVGRRIGVDEFYLPRNANIYKEFLSSQNKLGGTEETSTSEV